jgi:hypothetical protein
MALPRESVMSRALRPITPRVGIKYSKWSSPVGEGSAVGGAFAKFGDGFGTLRSGVFVGCAFVHDDVFETPEALRIELGNGNGGVGVGDYNIYIEFYGFDAIGGGGDDPGEFGGEFVKVITPTGLHDGLGGKDDGRAMRGASPDGLDGGASLPGTWITGVEDVGAIEIEIDVCGLVFEKRWDHE